MNAKLDGEFREFMHARWPVMVRLAYGLTGDQGHAEDVAQHPKERRVAFDIDRMVDAIDLDRVRHSCIHSIHA